MPYLIADESFSAKVALTDRCRAIPATTTDGQMVDDDCAEFLFELFQYHDEWDQKASGGVRGISTQTTRHGTRCFGLLNRGGDRIDISFPHAIRLVPNTRTAALRDFRSAARNAVRAEIYGFRDRALQEVQDCPYTGETLARSTCAVDHAPPKTFDELLFDFCQAVRSMHCVSRLVPTVARSQSLLTKNSKLPGRLITVSTPSFGYFPSWAICCRTHPYRGVRFGHEYHH